ncbi:hypothetical protein T484DRAFT_1744968 [Baffinella frigidus]|nr:hypothetical protein T484DRAFT_1744968 [Cryptophyta sp. CCMP2293]|eukprot:CAMPEP_0180263438 /NCGR_PEP_ID=MMETSP0987-20121128/45279_1 /TAXON_ID=697907 /ORGANISM="non described non described, Strain CCMP2293" /LENGTH=178 /DNA_ID=CAMNT_0022233663 /DNA_START=1 /DNA_END=537 /DNA_ORIENTATION=+
MDGKAPYSPPHCTATATRKQSHLNVVTDGIKKDVRSHLHARPTSLPARAAASVHDKTASRLQSAPSLHLASSTITRAPSTGMSEVVEQPEVVCKLEESEWDVEDAGCSDWRSTAADGCATDEETVGNKAADCERTDENGELLVLEDNAPHQSAPGVGSLAPYWDPWESELIENDTADI